MHNRWAHLPILLAIIDYFDQLNAYIGAANTKMEREGMVARIRAGWDICGHIGSPAGGLPDK